LLDATGQITKKVGAQDGAFVKCSETKLQSLLIP
jgi:hypothetical protein